MLHIRLNFMFLLISIPFLHLKGQQILMRLILSVFIGWIDPRPSSSLVVDAPEFSKCFSCLFFLFCCSFSDTTFDLFFVLR